MKDILGRKLGESIYSKAHGIDNTPLTGDVEQKTVNVGINWGIRLSTENELSNFLFELVAELEERLSGNSACKITLKLMLAIDVNVEPTKYLGHGKCTEHSKSVRLTSNDRIFEKCLLVFQEMHHKLKFLIQAVRGISIHAELSLFSSPNKQQEHISEFFKPKYNSATTPSRSSVSKSSTTLLEDFNRDDESFSNLVDSQHITSNPMSTSGVFTIFENSKQTSSIPKKMKNSSKLTDDHISLLDGTYKVIDCPDGKLQSSLNCVHTDSKQLWEIKRTLNSFPSEDEKFNFLFSTFALLYNQRQFDCIQSLISFVKRTNSNDFYLLALDMAQSHFAGTLKIN